MDGEKDLFERVDDFRLRAHGWDGLDQSFTLEELYQAFKERMLRELAEEGPEATRRNAIRQENEALAAKLRTEKAAKGSRTS